jgi:DnaK suppressor protein
VVGSERFTNLLHNSHQDVAKGLQAVGMNIDASKQTTSTAMTPTSPAREPRRFTAPPLARNEISLGDWRPGVQTQKNGRQRRLDAFAQAQREKLLELRSRLSDSMSEIARETRVEFCDSSVFATHNGDAGSDACDRDLALCLLSQETNVLTEIDEALERIESGSYGICEMSGQPIPASRLKAIPFARFTVEWQAEIEKRRKVTPSQRCTSPAFSEDDEEEIEEPEKLPR